MEHPVDSADTQTIRGNVNIDLRANDFMAPTFSSGTAIKTDHAANYYISDIATSTCEHYWGRAASHTAPIACSALYAPNLSFNLFWSFVLKS